MKKIISVISLLLIAAMVMAIPAVAAEGDGAWTPPAEMNVIYAYDLTGKDTPMIDGVISPNEYGAPTREEEPLPMASAWPDYGYKIDEANDDMPQPDQIDFYFAYDETSIYFAFKEVGGTFSDGDPDYQDFSIRNNYSLGFGFQLDDLTNYIALSGGAGGSAWSGNKLSFSDGKLSSFTSMEETTDQFLSEMFVNKYSASDPDVVYAYGDIFSPGNNNAKGPYILEVEMKLDKDTVLEVFNKYAYTDYANLPDAMYFLFRASTYRNIVTGSTKKMITGENRYLATDIRGKADNFFEYGILPGSLQEFLPTLVVFGDQNKVLSVPSTSGAVVDHVVTEPAATEPAATEPAATEPAGDDPAATEPVATEPTATEPTATEPAAEGGCGGAISFAGLALVAALGTCTVFVAKKKEN